MRERRQFSKEDVLSPLRRNKNYILGRHNISDGASDADWQKCTIAAFVVADLPSRQIRLNWQQSRATENDSVRIVANMEEISKFLDFHPNIYRFANAANRQRKTNYVTIYRSRVCFQKLLALLYISVFLSLYIICEIISYIKYIIKSIETYI